jgi:hypothetical protein
MTGSDMPDKIADSLYFKSGNLVIRSSIPSKPKSTVDFNFWPVLAGIWSARGLIWRQGLICLSDWHFNAASFQEINNLFFPEKRLNLPKYSLNLALIDSPVQFKRPSLPGDEDTNISEHTFGMSVWHPVK